MSSPKSRRDIERRCLRVTSPQIYIRFIVHRNPRVVFGLDLYGHTRECVSTCVCVRCQGRSSCGILFRGSDFSETEGKGVRRTKTQGGRTTPIVSFFSFYSPSVARDSDVTTIAVSLLFDGTYDRDTHPGTDNGPLDT